MTFNRSTRTKWPRGAKVQRVQAQIDALKAEMNKERANLLRRVGNEYTAALRREALLSKARTEQQKVVADQSDKAIHYDTLKRDVDSNRHIYEMMLQRVKEASLAAAMRDSNVLVVDRARAPLRPPRPGRRRADQPGLHDRVGVHQTVGPGRRCDRTMGGERRQFRTG